MSRASEPASPLGSQKKEKREERRMKGDTFALVPLRSKAHCIRKEERKKEERRMVAARLCLAIIMCRKRHTLNSTFNIQNPYLREEIIENSE